jgi:uncharacterized OB-fold protein
MSATPDPRPRLDRGPDGVLLAGVRCKACGYPSGFPRPRCPRCRGPVEAAGFGPLGTVWSATVVRIPVPGREPPYGLAYVDLDQGPRILAHVADDGAVALAPGARVRLRGLTGNGDPEIEAVP